MDGGFDIYFTLVHSVIMKPRANQFGLLQGHRSATPVVLGSQRSVLEGRRSMRVPGRSCFSLAACGGGFLFRAQAASGVPFRPALARTPNRLASGRAQPWVSVSLSRSARQRRAEKPSSLSGQWSNTALNLVRFALWTLRDKAAQRRLASR